MSSFPRPAASGAADSAVRINWKALAVLLGLGLGAGGLILGLALARQGRSRGSVEREVGRLVEAGRDDLALRHINGYLSDHPDDPVLLRQQARLLTRRAETVEQLLGASRVYERLGQVAAGDPELADATRRELTAVYIKFSDALHATALFRGLSEQAAYESRYLAAEAIARQLVEDHPDDAECRRLLAMALEGRAVAEDAETLAAAVEQYVKALRLDPGHIESSERLARLYRDRLKDRAKAEAVLDRLAAASTDPIEPHLARYRYFRELARTDRSAEALAGRELEEALKRDSTNLMVRLAAAEHALRNGRALEAREHMGALQDSDDFRISIMKGLVEFAQEHPQEALEQWRQGLIQLQGTHAQLTWWLAYVQLRLGRVEQAAPLVAQYRRLVENDDDYGLQFLQALSDERGGRPKRAVTTLERIRDQAPERLREEIVVALGRCYEALGERDLALRTYRLAAQTAPGSSLPRLAITTLLLERGPEAAVAELSAAVEAEGSSPDPELLMALAKAQVLRQASRPEGSRVWGEVDRLLARLEEAGVRPSTLALLRADRAALAGRPAAAVETLEAAAAIDPINPTVWAGLAAALSASGKNTEALAALDRGAKPEAAGDSATLRLIRARTLVAMDRGRDAQGALVDGSEGLPVDQQASLWEAAGRLRATQGDLDGARTAYRRWAQVSPATPQPELALLQTALLQRDRTAAKGHLDRLFALGGGKDHGGGDDLNYRLGRALFLYQFAEARRGGAATESERAQTASELQEAERLTDGIIKDAPKLAPAYLLKGQIVERRGQLDAAALAYREAWDRGGEAALPRLLDVMARLKRFDEIEGLAGPQGTLQIGALSAGALLNAGESERAAKLLNQMVADPARTDAWRTRLLELAGKTDAVEAILRARAERAPADDSTSWYALIATQARHGRPAAVVDATIAEFLARARTDRPDLLRAGALWSAGRLAQAERAFEQVAADRAGDAQALAEVSTYYEQTGRADRAAELLEKAIVLDRGNGSAGRQLAVILSGQAGDAQAAARAWELVGGDVEPKAPEDRLARAVVLARSPEASRRERAIPALEALVSDLDPRVPAASAARAYLVRLLLAAGRADRAVSLASITADRGDNATAIALHAQALIAAGRHADAEAEIDRLLTLNPLDPSEPALRVRLVAERAGESAAPAALVDAVARRGATPGATALGRAAFDWLVAHGAAEAAPDSPILEATDRIAEGLAGREPALGWMKALALNRRGRFDDALTACRDAVAAPNATEADRYEACRMAAAVAGGGDRPAEVFAKAAAVIEAALERRSDDPALLTMRAMVHHNLGEYDREVALYRRVLEIWPAGRPETDQIQNNLAWVLSEGSEKPDEALAMADALVVRRGDALDYLCTRGVILIRLGQAERAVADLEKAVQGDPTNGRRLLHLARAYRAAGRDDQFRAALERLRLTGLSPTNCDPTERGELQALLRL